MIALLLVAALGFAGTQAAPQTPTPPATGTISGVVRVGDSNTMLAGATVHYNRLDTSFDPSVPDLDRKPALLKTSDNGRFSFPDLPAGRYLLWIEDPPGFDWMDRRIYSLGVSVTLGPSQHVDDIVFRFAPRGSISGRVLDARGEPLVGAFIEAACVLYREGKRNIEGCGGGRATTDTQGNYRIFWIAPGKHYIRTEYHPTTDATHPYSYYPGTSDEAQAVLVEVKPGSELTGIDFSLATPPSISSYMVSGKVVGLSPQVANRPMGYIHLLRHDGTSSGLGTSYSNVAGDISGGQFQIRGVRSGVYELWTELRDDSGLIHTARATVEVAGANVEDLVVGVLPAVDLYGRIFIDGKPPDKPFGPDAIPPRIYAIDGTPEYASFQHESKGLKFNRDTGEFTILRVPPGRYKIAYLPFELPNGYVADVRMGNRSVPDGFAIGEDTPQLIDVFSSSLGATIDGVVTGADLNPVFGATIAVASVPDAGKDAVWYGPLKTDKAGHFSMSRFSPGQYRIYAWINPPEGDPWENPNFMSRYELLGQSVIVTSGNKTTVRITAIPEDK